MWDFQGYDLDSGFCSVYVTALHTLHATSTTQTLLASGSLLERSGRLSTLARLSFEVCAWCAQRLQGGALMAPCVCFFAVVGRNYKSEKAYGAHKVRANVLSRESRWRDRAM